MRREDFTYDSADGISAVHAVRWYPDGEIRAVLQIAHGMAEYIGRYEEFAADLTEHGILVAGNDHLGHGQSVTDESGLGFFSDRDPNGTVLADLRGLHRATRTLYPDVPYFFLGHSMGSFLCRQYIAEYGNELAGAVIMGTGDQPGIVTAAAKFLCRIIALFHGWHYRSRFINGLAFGSYNQRFGEKGGADWLSVRRENVERYEKDPLCGFPFTLNGYYGLFTSIHCLSDSKAVGRTPSGLPLLIVSGGEDPVGAFGKGPEAVAGQYRKLGVRNVTLKLFPGDRHEILNEEDRKEVYRTICEWMSENGSPEKGTR